MLLALSIRNFKSIREADVRFGPLTCFIGHNGVGKSNLFDAIHFLSALAERSIGEATAEVRRTPDRRNSPLDLVFGRDVSRQIELSADMVVPTEVTDDFGETARPSTTFLNYQVRLKYVVQSDRLLVAFEQLTHIKLGDIEPFFGYEISREFRQSVTTGSRRGGPLISTRDQQIWLHGDGGSRGRPAPVGRSPLTVLGGTNTAYYPTVLAAKREMASWRLLQLEPTAMRTPDARSGLPSHVTASGGCIPATLHSLMQRNPNSQAEVLQRLRQLNDDIKELGVDVDEARDQIELRARTDGVDNWLYGRSLSDGTLRYIALALMLVDVQDRAVLCIEEPENGIHPSRIDKLARLLEDYAVDPREPVAEDNPLRQVILNTHSPEVARQFTFDDMVFVQRATSQGDGLVSVFRPVVNTWRASLMSDSSAAPPAIATRAVSDFIGGSPVNASMGQMQLEFGTAQ